MPFDSKPQLRYLDLRPMAPVGGRGNAVRLFLLANDVPFDEELTSFEKWGGGEKKRVKESGEQPAGHLPVLKVGEKFYAEHMSICRFVARQEDLYGKDAQLDYEMDSVGDAQDEWRCEWALALNEAEDSEKMKTYRGKREGLYEMMEGYYKQRTAKDGPYVVPGDKPGFGDAATFNMLRDDQLFHGKMDMAPYPNLKALYEACDAVPAVRKWIEEWEAREV